MRLHSGILTKFAAALAILLLLTAPTAAQEQDAAAISFELTLYGSVPEGDIFGVVYSFRQQGGSSNEQIVLLCGGDSGVECEGNGTVYRHSDVAFNPYLGYGFFRRVDSNGENIVRDTATVTRDSTFQAYYDYRTGTGGFGTGPEDEKDMPGIPDTGAGGMAYSSPLDQIAGAVALAAGGYAIAVRRLRYWY